MSVTTITPSPASTSSAAAQISFCLASRSCSGSIGIAPHAVLLANDMFDCGQVFPCQATMRHYHYANHPFFSADDHRS